MQRGNFKFYLFGIQWLPVTWNLCIPESMQEMTYTQKVWWVEHVYNRLDSYFEKTEKGVRLKDVQGFDTMKLMVCKYLTGIPGWLWGTLDPESARNLLYTWDIASFTYNETYLPESNPVLQLGKYIGPSDEDDLVPWQFAFADAMYLRYKKNKKVADLNTMLAHLYLEKNTIKYSEKTVQARIPEIAKCDFGEKLLAIYWYEQWRNSLPKQFKHLFSKPRETKAQNDSSWLPVFMKASNGIENFDKIQHMNLMILLADLNMRIGDQKVK